MIVTELPVDTELPAGRAGTWQRVCGYQELEPERGVAVLVDGVQFAVFRLFDGTVAAVSHRDPFSGANVIARGIVGTRGERAVVSSPMHKQVFDLRTGICLDDERVRLAVPGVRVVEGWVELAAAAP